MTDASPATHCQGLALTDLAAEFGTPLYLYDADLLRTQYNGLRERLHPALRLFYSLKANPNLAVTRTMRELGAGLELSSLAELATAQRAGATGAEMLFLGPGKSRDEIAACLKAGARLIAESLPELAVIDEEARHRGTTAEVLLRVNPAFELKGGGLTMGGKPRQFGIDEEALDALAPADLRRYGNVRVTGVRVHGHPHPRRRRDRGEHPAHPGAGGTARRAARVRPRHGRRRRRPRCGVPRGGERPRQPAS